MLDLIATDQQLKVRVIRRGPKKGNFPFSWMLQEELDSQLKDTDKRVNFSDPVALRQFISSHPYNQWAQDQNNYRFKKDAVDRYISDLLATWSGSLPENFTEAIRKSIEPKIQEGNRHHIEYMHWYFVSNLPDYEKLWELFDVMDEKRDTYVQSVQDKKSFIDMLTCTMQLLMEDLQSPVDADKKKWRLRIDDCYCLAHEMFKKYQGVKDSTILRLLWNKIMSASLLYDVLTASKTTCQQVSDSINIFLQQFRGDVATLDGFQALNEYLEAKWKRLHLKDSVDLCRLHMYITSDVVLLWGRDNADLADYIFNSYVMRTTKSVASTADLSAGLWQTMSCQLWQTVSFYFYCLLKRSSFNVYDKVCEVLGRHVDVDESYVQICISCLELHYRDLKTGLPDFAEKNSKKDPANTVKDIARLRAVTSEAIHKEEFTRDWEKCITDRIVMLCEHQSKPKFFWLRENIVKQDSSRAMDIFAQRSAPSPGCVACKQSLWDELCVPTLELFASDLTSYCINPDIRKSLHVLQVIMEHREEIKILKYLYDIVDLTVTLQRKFSGRLNEQNVCNMPASKFDRFYAGGELASRFRSFVRAWNAVYASLSDCEIFYHEKKCRLLKELCNSITEDSPMRTFLFTSTEGNVCPLALATYLANLQNKILSDVDTILGRKPKVVPLLRMKESHALLLNDDSDLLSVILGHYSFSQPNSGERVQFQYDYVRIQERLVNIFIRRARQLEISDSLTSSETVDLPMFRFNELVVTAEHVSKITIKQDALDVHIQEAIQKQLRRDVSDLRDFFEMVKNGIAFLQYPSDDYGEYRSLKEYMKSLKVDTDVFVDQMFEKCQLRHVRSLWLLLSYELSKALTLVGQKCLVDIDSSYHKSLEGCPDVMNSLKIYLVRQQRALLACLLKHFHDYIMLELATTGQRKQDAKPSDKLFVKLSDFPNPENPSENLKVDLRNVLNELRDKFGDFSLEYCVPLWIAVFDIWTNQPY